MDISDTTDNFLKRQPTCKECGAAQYKRYGHLAECSQFLDDAGPIVTDHETAIAANDNDRCAYYHKGVQMVCGGLRRDHQAYYRNHEFVERDISQPALDGKEQPPMSMNDDDQLSDLQRAVIEHDGDMARLDRNTLTATQPAPEAGAHVHCWHEHGSAIKHCCECAQVVCEPTTTVGYNDAPASGAEWSYIETRHGAEVDTKPLRLRAHWDGLVEPEHIRELMRDVVANHRAVPLLVNALVAARREICQLTWEGTKPRKRQAEALVAQIDATLNAARGGGVEEG